MEIFIGLGGLFLGVVGMIARDAFTKGRSQETIKNLLDEIVEIKKRMTTVEKHSLLHEQALITFQKDHMKIDDTVKSLNESINKNNQALASLEATMGGLKQLLQNIFDGNLKITG